VDRPAELSQAVEALLSGEIGTVGITTELRGAGGFGKTTIARQVCAAPPVRQAFGNRIYFMTVGRELRAPVAVAAKVNDLIKVVSGENATFTDPELAGQRLAALLHAGPRCLLILDDVWEPYQLAPFAAGKHDCARLVTTRNPQVLAGQGRTVVVDQMPADQARAVLAHQLPSLDHVMADRLLRVTGRWPLLLRLANRILVNAVRAGVDANVAAEQLLAQFLRSGPAAADDLLGIPAGTLNIDLPDERARAVRATMAASTSLLERADAARLSELAVFAEDEAMPFHLIARLWRWTGGLNELQASQVAARLASLGIIGLGDSETGGRMLTMHDVIRDFLRFDLGPQRLAELHGTLLDMIASGLPGTQANGDK
jgi:NB-ARC domain